MKSLTLKHLRYLSALAQHRQFSRAAEASFVSQPALSIQIRELENIVGAPLVERSARQIHMTPLGEELVRKANEILFSVDEFEDLIRASEGAFSGRFRLGVIPTIAPYLLPDAVTSLSSIYPALKIIPKEAITQVLVEELLAHRLDAAIVALPLSNPLLQEFALFEEDFVLVRNKIDMNKPVPSAKKLKEMRLLLLDEGHCFRDQALSFCDISSSMPRDVMEGSSLSTLVQMVDAGMGLTLIPEMALLFETKSADVNIVRFGSQIPSRSVGLIWRKSNPLVNQLMEIAASVRQVGQDKQNEIRAAF